jgi:two-component system, LytTR family, response regulator
MKAVIIDDSQNAINALQAKLKKHCPVVEIISSFTNPQEAIATIPLLAPDVIFIDVEMPTMDGFEVVKQINKFHITFIFVTGYDHYAIQAIKANAFDYLQKPIDVELLRETILRLQQRKNETKQLDKNALLENLIASMQKSQDQSQTISLTGSEGIVIVTLAEITRLESLSNYTKFCLVDGRQIVVSKTMGEYEALLLQHLFFRVHRGHIINLKQLLNYHKNVEAWAEMKDGSKVEVSDRKRKELTDKLYEMSII